MHEEDGEGLPGQPLLPGWLQPCRQNVKVIKACAHFYCSCNVLAVRFLRRAIDESLAQSDTLSNL